LSGLTQAAPPRRRLR